jgi:hypothetical protein
MMTFADRSPFLLYVCYLVYNVGCQSKTLLQLGTYLGGKFCIKKSSCTVNFDNGKKKYILLNNHQCTRTWKFKFVIN